MKRIYHYLLAPRYSFNRFQLNIVALILLTVGFVSGSYFTINKIINTFALNDTTKTWSFNAGTATDYTPASGIMTVDVDGAHPTGGVDGANKITNPAFVATNTSWTLTAVNGSTTPAGWIAIPGDTNYVATGAAFLAMKYEAKIVGKADGNIAYSSADVAESRALGTPWVNISQTEAINECAAISVGGAANHLITNNESMAIARNVELVGSNWSSGTSGTGCMYGGHNDNNPASAIAASSDDSLGWTGTNDSSSDTFECPFNTTIGAADGKEQRRTFALNNGNTIWDLSGNVWEWNSDTILGESKPHNNTAAWVQWTAFAPPGASTYGTLSYLKTRPTGSSYNSSMGIGQYYEGANTTGTLYAFLRGGGWDDGEYAGAFTLYLDYVPGIRGYNIGFRCASDPVAISQSWQSNAGRAAAGGNFVAVTSPYIDGKLTQNISVENTTYDVSAYVYDKTGAGGGVVGDTIAQLYYQGAVVNPTTYTPVTGEAGWYKLTGSVTTGAAATQEFGLLVKAGKSVNVDDFTLSKTGTYSVFNKNGYFKSDVSSWDSFSATVTNNGTNGSVVYQLCTDDLGDGSAVGQGTACEAQNKWKWWNGSAWVYATNNTTETNTAAQLTQAVMQHSSLGTSSKKISVKAILSFGGVDYPKITAISIGLTTDTTPPTNATNPLMNKENGGTCTNANNCWTKLAGPSFSWTAGSDTQSPTVWYCLYLGTDSAGNPASAKGKLGDTSPVTIPTGWTCQFIVSSTSLDLSTAGYLKTALSNTDTFTTTANTYFLNIKAVDNGGNTSGSSVSIKFQYDGVAPTNVTSINPAAGNFSNVADMNFSWPTSGSTQSIDNESGVLGWQYQINPSVDVNGLPTSAWKGTTNSTELNLDYIPATASAYTFVPSRDGDGSTAGVGKVSSGTNQIYFRTVDASGNPSSNATIRTGPISFGGNAPSFENTDSVTVTPSSSDTNSFALSWPAATPTSGKTVTHYYYMIKTTPPSTLATLQGNPSTYIDNGTATTVSAAALANVNKGSNTVYVVAIDNASTPNYSPSNYISGTFTLNSTTPDNVGNLVASDSSIKSQSQWNVTLTWTAPTYQGAGNLSYLVYRSADGTTFAQVGSSSGLSYVDNTPLSAKYYYKVYTKDGANATSSGTNAVSITPTGKWTSAPDLSTQPTASSITTKKATITWSTSRTADSKVSYGTSSGSYGSVEPSNSSQVTSHSIQLTGLNPGTTYYYKVKWTDEDGNTGTSDEKSFTTSPAPTVKDVLAKNIGLTTAIIQFTSKDASKVKIYYGITSGFGGAKEISTSTTETAYTAELTGLADGTKYYYKINTFDSESSEYEGTILDFTTLPRPRITKVQLQQVANTAQTTILVTWTTNTEISSIVTYYPKGETANARDEVNVALTKGEHKMILRGLLPQTDYLLVVKGRDKIGNEAISDTQSFTSASDSRPPQTTGLHVEGSTVPAVSGTAQETTAQLIVSWNTDEPSSSQVEFGEGTGTTYSSKTQEDSNLTLNHLVIISNLTPSKVYHLKALSKDKAGNIGESVDTVTITPKATDNALNLVISNLQQIFGFMGNINQ